MKANEANEILKSKMEELIVKMNAQQNHDVIMAMVDKYIAEASNNSAYDQVANINTIVKWYDNGDVKAFLGAIQHMDTLNHINRL